MPPPALSTSSSPATELLRRDLQSRLGRFVPIVLAALFTFVVLQKRSTADWITGLQVLSCASLLALLVFGRRVPTSVGALVVVTCLIVFGVSQVSGSDLLLAAALGVALALLVAQASWQPRRRWIYALLCAAGYVGLGTLVCADLFVGESVGASHLLVTQWIFLSVLCASFAFTVFVETDRMLQQFPASAPPVQTFAHNEASDRAAGLEAENRALQSTNRDLEDFVYAISHDLRAPLRAVAGFAQLLADDLRQPLTPEAARDLAGIATGVERMQALVTRWLNLARRDHAGLQREQVDLSAIANALGEELRLADPRRSVAFAIEPNLIADVDSVLVRELLQNLLGNAWKFTAHNTDSALVEFGACTDCGTTTYFVRDNGAGFDPARADQLFRPFQRLHAKDRFDGVGIGLTIAQRIVERHQGRIWADARPDRGATFWFTLGAGAAPCRRSNPRCIPHHAFDEHEVNEGQTFL